MVRGFSIVSVSKGCLLYTPRTTASRMNKPSLASVVEKIECGGPLVYLKHVPKHLSHVFLHRHNDSIVYTGRNKRSTINRLV